MNDDSVDAMLAAHSGIAFPWPEIREDIRMRQVEEHRQSTALAEFRKSYIKIRTDNIVLDHQCAIELTKMIFSEAATLTYKDTL